MPAIPWDYWFEDLPYRVLWFDPDSPAYFFLPRLIVLLLQTLAIVMAATWAAYAWERWKGPVTFE